MTAARPWQQGDSEARWLGYFAEPGSVVLRNRLGLTDALLLQAAEDDLVEFRLAELRANPWIVPRTYDLPHLQALHRQLFQDVYDWAGDVRTVGLAKGGGESFMPPAEIERPVGHAAHRIATSDRLRDIPAETLAPEIAYLYDYINFAHPFREGNGRTQREFFAQLLAESGHTLDWDDVDRDELHEACHRARNDDHSAGLVALISRILRDDPAC